MGSVYVREGRAPVSGLFYVMLSCVIFSSTKNLPLRTYAKEDLLVGATKTDTASAYQPPTLRLTADLPAAIRPAKPSLTRTLVSAVSEQVKTNFRPMWATEQKVEMSGFGS